MTPKVPEEYFEFRKQEIIKAAWKCFAERGYHRTTIRDIAKSINLSTGVIYNYFNSKDEILDALFLWALESEEQIFNSMAKKENSKEAIVELFNTCFEICPFDELQKSAKANIHILSESMTNPKIQKLATIQFNQSRDKLALFINDGIKKGEIQADVDPKSLAGFYMALITGLQVQSTLTGDSDFTSYFKEIKRIMFQSVWEK